MKETIQDNIPCSKSAEISRALFRYSLKYVSVNTRKPPAEITIVVESSKKLSAASLFNLSEAALRLSSFKPESSEVWRNMA
ncbi:MAG: hypothetical protein JRN15_04130 [Nitrososphaerota archaeon]|nr:hypothetical protein [Nitrososphaerota archaeon]